MTFLFDYFGVIASDAYWYTVQDEETNLGNGDEIKHLADDVNTGKLSWHDFCQRVANDLGISTEEVENRYNQHNINRGVVNIIRSLSDAGQGIALASNAASEHLAPILEKTGLDQLFDRTFFSSDIGRAKPEKSFYQAILDSYQQPAGDFVFIDDLAVNTEAAADAGMRAVHFESAEKLEDDIENILT